jgi:hypothetical protein
VRFCPYDLERVRAFVDEGDQLSERGRELAARSLERAIEVEILQGKFGAANPLRRPPERTVARVFSAKLFPNHQSNWSGWQSGRTHQNP